MATVLSRTQKVVVLGVGRVGRTIALDLADAYKVVAVDVNSEILKKLKGKNVKTVKAHATDRDALVSLIADSDLAINALPGHLGFEVLKNVIDSGKRIVDISFFPEDPFALDALARARGICAVVDCGIAPGLINMILGHHCARMIVKNFVCYVGGLPKARVWPYQYKAPFSPIDVIEIYTRPARLVENGEIVAKPALSDSEYIDFEGIGTLEAFNSDGLRTLLRTVKVPNMKDKTLRYPGHIEYMKVLGETGFFSSVPIDINGSKISPMEMTSRLLFPFWQLGEGEEEFTIMRVIVEGEENGRETRYTYDLYDEYDRDTGTTSMARTTGYTSSAVARLILEGQMNTIGIVPPEYIGMDEDAFDSVMSYLAARNVNFQVKRTVLG